MGNALFILRKTVECWGNFNRVVGTVCQEDMCGIDKFAGCDDGFWKAIAD